MSSQMYGTLIVSAAAFHVILWPNKSLIQMRAHCLLPFHSVCSGRARERMREIVAHTEGRGKV